MYCYTVLNSFICVLRELDIWTDISSEHHTFLLTVGKLTKKKISKNLKNKMNESQENFISLNEDAKEILENYQVPTTQADYHKITEKVADLLNKFLNYDRNLLILLEELSEIGKRDEVWQTLVKHIKEEQTYMFRLFSNLLKQLIKSPI